MFQSSLLLSYNARSQDVNNLFSVVFQSSLLLSYNARSQDVVSLYGSNVRHEISPDLAANLGVSQQQLCEINYLAQQPKVIPVKFCCQLISHVHLGLEKAVEETGGIAAVLYLVAKVK